MSDDPGIEAAARAAGEELRRQMLLCRGPNNAGQSELLPDEYVIVARIVLEAAQGLPLPAPKYKQVGWMCAVAGGKQHRFVYGERPLKAWNGREVPVFIEVGEDT